MKGIFHHLWPLCVLVALSMILIFVDGIYRDNKKAYEFLIWFFFIAILVTNIIPQIILHILYLNEDRKNRVLLASSRLVNSRISGLIGNGDAVSAVISRYGGIINKSFIGMSWMNYEMIDINFGNVTIKVTSLNNKYKTIVKGIDNLVVVDCLFPYRK